MTLIIHSTFLPHDDAEAALVFYRDTLGFEVRNDVGYEGLRWLTVGPPDQPEVNIVLYPPSGDPNISEEELRTITELMAKGTYASLMLASDDLDATFARIEAAGADIMQEPIDQDWGSRDCAVRDPAGNTIRIQQR